MGTLKRQILAVLVIFTLVFASASLAFAVSSLICNSQGLVSIVHS